MTRTTHAPDEPAALPEAHGDTGNATAVRYRRWIDAGVGACYLALALVVLGPLWMNLDGGYLTNSGQDQNMWEWFFAATAHNVLNWQNPLSSTLQNYPAGVNMMANTAMLGLSVPLTPVTVLFGPTVTWALVLTGGLAATAGTWYCLFSRYLVRSRLAAAIGGAFAGFAPPIISHANAHPNFVALFVFPFIVAFVLKLARGYRPVRNGVILGLLLSYQAMLGEEALLIGATTFAVFAGVYCLCRRDAVAAMTRTVGTGAAVALGVCAVLLAFPLWWQFFGPQSYTTLEHGPSGNDLAAFTTFATESLAGTPNAAAELSLNRTEENAFFGAPLVILWFVLAVWLWRIPAARAASLATLIMAWISTGALLIVNGTVTSIPGPWMILGDLPLYGSVLESRFALGCVPLIGMVLAMATDRVTRVFAHHPPWRVTARVTFAAALTVALLPIAPTPLPVHERAPVPAFFADGTWREFVTPDGSVVVAPLPDPGDADALHWQIATGMAFPLAGGYFVGPHGEDDSGGYGADRTPTSWLLEHAAQTGEAADVDSADRRRARLDLRYWDADVVVLAPAARHRHAVRVTMTRLLGKPPRHVNGVWIWDVRE